MRTLKIKLNLNAKAVVTAPFTVVPPIGDAITFQKGGILIGQHDGGENPFWITHEEYIMPIEVFEPITIQLLQQNEITTTGKV